MDSFTNIGFSSGRLAYKLSLASPTFVRLAYLTYGKIMRPTSYYLVVADFLLQPSSHH